MTVNGIIFSNLHDSHLPELTAQRTIASVPFGCRYRFVDFALSNMVNAGITDVNVLTHHNYRSLMDHIGTGMDWDLSRRSGGLMLFPPFVSSQTSGCTFSYENHLEALKNISHAIARFTSDHVVLSDSDIICNIDLKDVIDSHVESGADITAVVKKVTLSSSDSDAYTVIESDEQGAISGIVSHPRDFSGEADISVGVWIMRCSYLQRVVADAVSRGYVSFKRDVIAERMGKDTFKIYRYDGFYAAPHSIQDYFEVSMSMLEPDARSGLFGVKNRPVYTKVRNSPPTIHTDGAEVSNSLIADGCVIEGTVENSILFRGVKVGKGAVVKNCILFQDTQISAGASVKCVVADKNVVIRSGVELAGHPSMPICIGKGRSI